MHIRAAMAALRLDLDHADKVALLVVACRADRYTGEVTRSVPALAADSGLSERTLYRALGRLTRRGYLQVSHRLGMTSTYRLGTPVTVAVGTGVTVSRVPVPNATGTRDTVADSRRKTGEKREGAARPLAARATGVAVDNGAAPPRFAPTRPDPHPPECECDGSGWLYDDASREVRPCEH